MNVHHTNSCTINKIKTTQHILNTEPCVCCLRQPGLPLEEWDYNFTNTTSGINLLFIHLYPTPFCFYMQKVVMAD